MEIYSEFYNGDRKATVTLISRSWNPQFNVWEVAMYQNHKVLERRTMESEHAAENLAEDFVNGASGGSVLLNEGQ